MSKPPKAVAADEIEECPRCGKPLPLCICDSVTPIANRVELLILQHPQEQDRALGTARLTAQHFEKVTHRIGLSWPSLSKALGRTVDPQDWAILYLGSAKVADLATDKDVVAINRQGEIEDHQRQILKDIEGVVLLDGTWSQAKALWWRNAWMLRCRRIILGLPSHRSMASCARSRAAMDCRPRGRGHGSGRLEGRPDIEAELNATFQRMLTQYREVQSSTPELAPKPKKRDYRRPENRRGKGAKS